MPRKCRFTREDVIQAALQLVREGGPSALTARALGEKLGCSARPIFSLFRDMGEVQTELLRAADELYQGYLTAAQGPDCPPYKASGLGYIRFAAEEKELFRLLFMRDRSAEGEYPPGKELDWVLDLVQSGTGLPREGALRFHLEMWVFVHGIAVMLAAGYLPWKEEDISRMLTDIFQGLRARFTPD